MDKRNNADSKSKASNKTSDSDSCIKASHHAENTNNTFVTSDDSEQVPAILIKLSGKYLIEASAGTGKTWTLTGIVLRLLIEGRRAPEHIIATTFTRAAAAEMRQRIHDRLVDFYQLLQWLNNVQANPNTHQVLYPKLNQRQDGTVGDENVGKQANKQLSAESSAGALDASSDNKIRDEQVKARKDWLEEKAKLSGNADLIADPINLYLLTYLLDHTEDYSLADAMRRCALVLTTLDKLFVGTLDSLSQKWLSEYSAETGHQQGIQISDQEQSVIESIIHDAVRAHHSYLYHQQPEVYQLLQHSQRLTSPADHLNVAQKSMQFVSTPIEAVDLGDEPDFATYQKVLEDFKQCDLKDMEPYFNKDYRKEQGFNARASIGTRADKIVNIQTAVEQYGHAFFANLDEDAQKFYEAVPKVFISEDDGGKGFNKNKNEQRLAFINLESMQALKAVYDYTNKIESYLDALVENLNRDIALKVRQKLPAILESRGETTFALQMVRLNQALCGKQGERLARYIRHHYPVALIDESQDINGEQARMIERIYLSKNSNNAANDTKGAEDGVKEKSQKKGARGFLLLVGDPKQAIYGFRGGDVANYNAMKAKFNKSSIMSLDINRRSNERLISALNHWFGRPSSVVETEDRVDDKASQLAQLGKHIYYQHIKAANTDLRLSWQTPVDKQLSFKQPEIQGQNNEVLPDNPVSVIHLPYDKDAKYSAYELTALHIAALLANEQTFDGRPIKPSDIGVLGRRKHELKQVEDMLGQLSVPTIETAKKNVFSTPIAADLAALLEAMLRPHRRDIINRVLTSNFYQMSLNEVQALMLSENDVDANTQGVSEPSEGLSELKERYQDFQLSLKDAAWRWQHNGVLSALHYLLGHNSLTSSNETHYSSIDQKQSKQSVWVGLAELEDGARTLMDLRHLLDILAEHGMHIGEHELLAWYKKNMNSGHTPEWARQQPLPTASGVQLMTIHKSKGLEFPIVYVVGMDGASPKAGSRGDHNLFLYEHTTDNGYSERRLSASKGKPHGKSAKGDVDTDYYAQFETTENYEELRRLGYVAFTRASEQLYIVLKDAYNTSGCKLKPSLQWLSCEEHKFVLPDRLHAHVGWLEYEKVVTNAQDIIKSNTESREKKSSETQSPNSDGTIAKAQTLIDYDDAYAQIKARYFKGWAKTSFTALSRQLSEEGKALAVFDDGVEDDIDIADGLTGDINDSDSDSDNGNHETGEVATTNPVTSDDIRFRFVKGANAGTFLHEIFEKINFNDNSQWSGVIDQSVRQYQLPVTYASSSVQQRLQPNDDRLLEKGVEDVNIADPVQVGVDHDALMAWIADVLKAPLLASGRALQEIPTKQRIAELGFNMGLSEDFVPELINQAFSEYLPDDPDKHIELNSQKNANYIYRYLRGEIDLVYECAGKYYVVDYKSNYLGNSLSNYSEKNLNAAMNKAGYWLQAAIYQVALHRFLRLRISDYVGNEMQYLGAVEYVFLRGIDSAGVQNYGRVQWQVPLGLVKALDDIFGYPSTI